MPAKKTASKKKTEEILEGVSFAKIKVERQRMLPGEVKIVGQFPGLMQHRFSKKALEMILAGQGVEGLEGALDKQPKDPRQDYLDALYVMGDVRPHRDMTDAEIAKKFRFGLPADALKACLVSAGRVLPNVTMTSLKQAIYVYADELDSSGRGLVALDTPKGQVPLMSELPVRIGKQKSIIDIRHRPLFQEWGATVRFKYHPEALKPADLIRLFDAAGETVGLLEGRMLGKESSGIYGLFEVDHKSSFISMYKREAA